jgi:hypothetical protein
MEILIVGIILVAVMAYLSTKIKKSAQAAYELEVFDNGEFTVTKPEGFIIPFNEKSPYAFEAYSKDFGDDDARKFNQCQATVSVKSGFKKNSLIKSKKNEKDVLIQVFTKTLGNKKSNKTYELEISLLDEYKEQYLEKIEAMLDSFALK